MTELLQVDPVLTVLIILGTMGATFVLFIIILSIFYKNHEACKPEHNCENCLRSFEGGMCEECYDTYPSLIHWESNK